MIDIGLMNFPILTPEQANPLGTGLINGLKAMIQARNQRAQTQAQEAKNPYVALQQQQALKNAMVENMLKRSQAGNIDSESAMNRFKLRNPAFMDVTAAAYSGMGEGNSGNPQQQPIGVQGAQNPQGAQISQGGGSQSPSSNPQQAQMPGNDVASDIKETVYGPQIPQFYNTGNPQRDAILNAKFLSPDQQAQIDLKKHQQQNLQNYANNRFGQMQEEIKAGNGQILNAQKFLNAYDDISDAQRGPLGGRILSLSSKRDEADAAAAAMQAGLATSLQGGGHLNDSTQKLSSLIKLNTKLTPDAAMHIAHDAMAVEDRKRLDAAMFNYGVNTKHMSPNFVEKVINKMQADIPAFNPETNLPNDYARHVWPDYFKPEMLDAIARGKDISPQSVDYYKTHSFSQPELDKLKKSNNYSNRDIMHTKENKNMSLYDIRQALKDKGAL